MYSGLFDTLAAAGHSGQEREQTRMFSYFDHLECSACFATYASTALMNLCTCGAPLLARYRLEEAAAALDRDRLEGQTLALSCHAPGAEPSGRGVAG